MDNQNYSSTSNQGPIAHQVAAASTAIAVSSHGFPMRTIMVCTCGWFVQATSDKNQLDMSMRMRRHISEKNEAV